MQLSIGTERSASDPEGIVLTVNFTVCEGVTKITPYITVAKNGNISVEPAQINASAERLLYQKLQS